MTNRSRPTRSRQAVRTLFAVLWLACLGLASQLAAQVTVNNTGGTGSNGLSATEASSIAGSITTDTMWADSVAQRWKMNNHNYNSGGSGGIPVAAWPCLHQGCIPYAGGLQGGVYAETELQLGTTPIGAPLLAGSTAPQWGSVDLRTVSALSNPTGTKLATVLGSPSTTTNLVSWDGSGNVQDSGIPAANAFFQTQTASTASLTVGGAHQLKYWAVYLRYPVTVAKVDFFVNTTDGTNNYDICIYDNAGGFGGTGNLKVNIGQRTMGTPNFNEVAPTQGTVTLAAGWYTFAWSSGAVNTAAFAADTGANYITPYLSSFVGSGNTGATATCPSTFSVPAASWAKSSLLWEGLHN